MSDEHQKAMQAQHAATRAAGTPRITPERIEEVIRREHYHVPPGTTHTLCVLQLANGFTVSGESVSAPTTLFDAAIGRREARAQAVEKIWALENYVLRNLIAGLQC